MKKYHTQNFLKITKKRAFLELQQDKVIHLLRYTEIAHIIISINWKKNGNVKYVIHYTCKHEPVLQGCNV